MVKNNAIIINPPPRPKVFPEKQVTDGGDCPELEIPPPIDAEFTVMVLSGL
jgi:hypothetical protein